MLKILYIGPMSLSADPLGNPSLSFAPSHLPQAPEGYRPQFSAGPCVKPKNWHLEDLDPFLMGRSHFSQVGLDLMHGVLKNLKEILAIPQDYHVMLCPGSASGAVELAIWNFLRPCSRGGSVDVMVSDLFSQLWARSVRECLDLPTRIGTLDAQIFASAHGASFFHQDQRYKDVQVVSTQEAFLSWRRPENPLIFTMTGTSHGTCLAPWIQAMSETMPPSQGLVICDATAAVMSQDIPWHQLDATCFSWQKGFGGEASFGVVVLSPKAYQHLRDHPFPAFPVPRIFRLRSLDGEIVQGLFRGEIANTPSLLLMQEAKYLLDLWRDRGGLSHALSRAAENTAMVQKWLSNHDFLTHLITKADLRATGPVCFTFSPQCPLYGCSASEQWAFIRALERELEDHHWAYETAGHPRSIASFRLWAGPSVEPKDLAFCLEAFSWVFHRRMASFLENKNSAI